MQRTQAQGFFERLFSFEAKPVISGNVWPLALALAWAFDLLFWRKVPGISFPLFVLALLACGFAVLKSASLSVAGTSKWLVVPIALIAAGPAIRAEPGTVVLDMLMVVLLVGLFADTATEGHWFRYRFTDLVIGFLHLGSAVVVRGGVDLSERRNASSAKTDRRAYEPYVRGVLISLPILLVFVLLFASADLVFSRVITRPFKSLDPDLFAEYAFRLLYIIGFAYLLAGLLLHAARKGRSEFQVDDHGGSLGLRRLSMVEGSIVLGSLTALFAMFVVIQLRYLFAGVDAITNQGYTYAQYAKRGFGELVFAALLVFGVIVGLSLLIGRDTRRQKTVFASLNTALVVFTGVVLTSAFQRLLLYEDAFGFTRARTYGHVFMVWLGLTLIAAAFLIWRDSLKSLALVVAGVAFGFVLTLNVIGVDALIARHNLVRAAAGSELDVEYLNVLSTDAIPEVIDGVDKISGFDRERVVNLLVCKAQESRGVHAWPSWNLSRHWARSGLQEFASDHSSAECGPLVPPPSESPPAD